MTAIPRQEPSAPRKGKRPPQPTIVAAPMPDPNPGLEGIESAVRHFASIVNTYVSNARNGDHCLEVYSGQGAWPVKVQLESEAIHSVAAEICTGNDQLERIATAFERIATALEGRHAISG